MTEATQESQTPQITIIDLQNAIHIIDVAAERGAFKGSELTSVGSIRDKLSKFVELSTPAEEADEEAAQDPAE